MNFCVLSHAFVSNPPSGSFPGNCQSGPARFEETCHTEVKMSREGALFLSSNSLLADADALVNILATFWPFFGAGIFPARFCYIFWRWRIAGDFRQFSGHCFGKFSPGC